MGVSLVANVKLLAVQPEGNSPLLPLLDIEHAFKVIRHYFHGQFSPLQPTFNARDIGTPTTLDTGERRLYDASYVIFIHPFVWIVRICLEG